MFVLRSPKPQKSRLKICLVCMLVDVVVPRAAQKLLGRCCLNFESSTKPVLKAKIKPKNGFEKMFKLTNL